MCRLHVCSDVFNGLANVRHNDNKTLFLQYFLPNIFWFAIPFAGIFSLCLQINDILATAA